MFTLSPRLTFSSFHFLFLLALVSCTRSYNQSADTLRKPVEWMWAQQSSDGGWHSKTHNVLEDGRVLTPYILFHMLQLPEKYLKSKDKAIEKGIDFIIKEMRGSIDENKSTLTDYPNYSAAYALRVLHKTNRDTALQKIIADYLLRQQFNESRGIHKDHLAYGGWGYGEPGLPQGQHGHVDISHTRRVTEALMECPFLNTRTKNEMKEKIVEFLKGAQRIPHDPRLYEGCISRAHIPYDGGFVSSVVTISTIKTDPVLLEHAGYHYGSYATASCDGLMTLHALKLEDSAQFKDVANWLKQNQNMHTIDGLPEGDPEQWAEVMHYYHLAVRSEAMRIIDPEGRWKKKIAAIIKNEQQHEGFFINPIGGVNKEDDPLMATIFCIQALLSITGSNI